MEEFLSALKSCNGTKVLGFGSFPMCLWQQNWGVIQMIVSSLFCKLRYVGNTLPL